MEAPSPESCDRRTVLRALAAVPLATLAGCSLLEDSEVLAGSRASLTQQGYLETDFNDARIHVRQTAQGLLCLDLTCTHKQCTVRWKVQEQVFVCPCHKGRFDAQGKVLAGKPTEPLHRLKAELRGEEVWVLNERE
ncbi:MAG: Rieske 2Fe-2S domain-containing protein [Bacteroidetes bacterium]|nr:Rieske 2Fe-2S domain-containing protein [Bacteroidota bacterium]